MIRSGQLVNWLVDARTRTFELVTELDPREMVGEDGLGLPSPTWLIGHLVWYLDRQVLGRDTPLLDDAVFDPASAPPPTLLEQPTFDEILPLSADVQNKVLEAIMTPDEVSAELARQLRYAIDREDWAGEQLVAWMQRKGHERPMLIFDDEQPVRPASSRLAGDAEIPALEGMFGAPDDDELADPGQRPERVVTVGGFRIARAPVTESEFLQFVEDGGYGNRDLWTEAGWVLTRAEDRRAPRYWQQRDGVWFRRDFDRWDELAERRPVSYVSAHEAEAYCRWAGRRLPTEEEWEAAASWKPDGAERSLYPWGIMPPQPALACLDGRELEPPSVDAFAAGDSAFGLRQMLGNVWEWTSSDMDTARVIRGGSFATRSRLLTCRTRRGLAPACDLMPTGFRSVER